MYFLFTMNMICFQLFHIFSTTHGMMLVKVPFANEDDYMKMQLLQEGHNDINVWQMSAKEMIAAVSDDVAQDLELFYQATILNYNLNATLERSLEANRQAFRKKNRRRLNTDPILYYLRYNEIVKFMETKGKSLPLVAFVRTIGTTFEGRSMKIMRFGFGKETKPVVLVLSGLHAREWLAASNGVYFIYEMSQKIMSNDQRIKNLLQKFDFYVIPVGNPDGYEYSWTGMNARMWRKTRSKQAYNCIGVDPNRNFNVDYHPHDVGCEEDACHITYRGRKAFSEKCTKSIYNFAKNPKMANRIKLFFDVHSYAQQFYYPFGYNSSKNVPELDEIVRVAKISVNAMMNVNNRKFDLGLSGTINYNASGMAMDWFYEVMGVKYSYTIETFPSFSSPRGFLALPKEIKSSGRETFEAIITAAENIKL